MTSVYPSVSKLDFCLGDSSSSSNNSSKESNISLSDNNNNIVIANFSLVDASGDLVNNQQQKTPATTTPI